MYSLIRSHRLELLADALIETLASERSDPFQAAWSVVAHPEMGQWLARRMARKTGVCAHQPFPLAATALWQMLRMVNPEIPVADRYSRKGMMAPVHAAVDEAAERSDPLLEPVRRYLGDQDDSARMRFAMRLARVFDQYLVYRPDWILDWEKRSPDHWQAWVWKRIAPGNPWHWARCWHWLMHSQSLELLESAPPAVNVFALPVISPSYLQCLARLSSLLPMTLYQWLPTAGYLGDIDSPRSRPGAGSTPPEVNPLLGSLAQPQRELTELLLENPGSERDLFQSRWPDSLLGELQRDLLDETTGPKPVREDRSLLIQRCSSAQREAEVCADELLRRFEDDPELKPDQVLVICPDPDQYLAPLNSVFGAPDSPVSRIPWRLVGAAQGHELTAAAALLSILDLLRRPPLNRRCLDLLRFPAVRRRFRLPADGQADRQRWLRSGGLFEQQQSGKFSWTAGMDRWVDAVTRGPLAGELDLTPIDAGETSELGRLARFLMTLDTLSSQARGLRPLSRWLDWTADLAQHLLEVDETERASLQQQRQALQPLTDSSEVAVSFGAYAQLALSLGGVQPAGGGRAGYLTVATPDAVRLLPARVIYVLGITDGQFPVSEERSELNLMNQDRPRRGDRIARAEQRLQFLEWLLSARDAIVLSGISLDGRSGEAVSLSSVLAELDGVVRRRYQANILSPQPLHPFSSRYGRTHIGYADYLNAEPPRAQQALADQAVIPPVRSDIGVHELLAFWQLPARWWVREVLGLWVSLGDDTLDGEPPLEVDALRRYGHLDALLQHGPVAAENLAAQVTVPDGPVGLASARATLAEADRLLRGQRQLVGASEAVRVSVDVTVQDWPIRGSVDRVYADQRVVVSAGKAKAKRLLDLWLNHLLLNMARGPARSVLLASDGTFALRPVDAPRGYLEALVSDFLQGQGTALPFFPETSRRHVDKGFDAARNLFMADDEWARSEAADLCVRQVWPDPERALQAPFAQLAHQVWDPLIDHLGS